MHYKIVDSGSSDGLQTLVNDFIKNGYVPAGGVFVKLPDRSMGIALRYYQAMIKPAPQKTGTDKF